jgi:hypothetical protein
VIPRMCARYALREDGRGMATSESAQRARSQAGLKNEAAESGAVARIRPDRVIRWMMARLATTMQGPCRVAVPLGSQKTSLILQ